MNDTWGALPCLGPVAHFHLDPAEGGPPLASADGHWWWDGRHWVALPEPGPECPVDGLVDGLVDGPVDREVAPAGLPA